jgi:uroporphyrinogen-III decarboxylase
MLKKTLTGIVRDTPWPLIVPLASKVGIQLTNTNITDNLKNVAIQLDTINAIQKRFPAIDMVFPIMDTTVEAKAGGCPFEYSNIGSRITEHIYTTMSEVKNIPIPDPYKMPYMSTNIEIVQELASIYNKPVGAYVLGPVTLAAHFMGINNLIKLAFREERSFLELLDFCVEFVLPYSQALIKEGAMLIVVLEPQVAIFSPIMYENLIQGSHEKFARRLVNPVLHVCGNTTKHVPSFSKTGCFAGLSLDAPVNLKVCLQNYDQLREVVLIGNISPVNDMLQGRKKM